MVEQRHHACGDDHMVVFMTRIWQNHVNRWSRYSKNLMSMSWFGLEFLFWIFWIYAWTCAIVLLILCLCLNGFVFLSLLFCVSELVILCSLNAFSVRFGLVLLNERRFMSFCSYILEHVVFVLSICCAWFWIFWVCLYHEYVVFDFEFSGFVFDFEFFGFVC